MDCCSHCEGVELQFDREKAARKLEKYNRNGPQKTTSMLVEDLERFDLSGKTLLDVGDGFSRRSHRRSVSWQVVVYSRGPEVTVTV